MKKLSLMLAGALMMLAPIGASSAVRVFVRPRFYAGPRIGYGYGFYNPYWGSGYYPGYYPAYRYDDTGTVKIGTKSKEGEVFVNGAYAGTVKDDKTMHFRQGNYRIEIRRGGQTMFNENVYVTAGKTVHINPEM